MWKSDVITKVSLSKYWNALDYVDLFCTLCEVLPNVFHRVSSVTSQIQVPPLFKMFYKSVLFGRRNLSSTEYIKKVV